MKVTAVDAKRLIEAFVSDHAAQAFEVEEDIAWDYNKETHKFDLEFNRLTILVPKENNE